MAPAKIFLSASIVGIIAFVVVLRQRHGIMTPGGPSGASRLVALHDADILNLRKGLDSGLFDCRSLIEVCWTTKSASFRTLTIEDLHCTNQ